MLGDLNARSVQALGPGELTRSEFRVFSQWGEDGVIQFLLRHVPIEDESFVEFGVEDYRESNTRFLLSHDNWRGLIIDGSTAHQEFVRESGLDWRHDLTTLSAFVDAGNINALLRDAGFAGDIGLLSIDVDGADLWILNAIESSSPRILICEYNSIFGPDAAVTVPYRADFQRSKAHWSNLYAGASIAAMTRVAAEKGYALVGSNRAGNNAFYVRRDVLGAIPERTPAEAWRESRFRESRDPDGELTFLNSHAERRRIIGDLHVWDLDVEREIPIAERFSDAS